MATAKLDEETVKKVIRQVEFYFSDSNLPRDKFMRETISKNEDGMVDLALICSFSRMRNHLNLGNMKPEEVPEDTVKVVAETLRNSTFLKVSDDGKKIGRASELLKPEEVIEQLDNRTIAASPLEYDVKLEDVESFFGQFAKVSSVRLPRHVADKRLFCGTAVVEFSTEEDAESILKQNLVYAGLELELKAKKDFDVERAKQEEEAESSRSAVGMNRRNNSTAEANYPKGLIVAFTLKSMSAEGSAEENANETVNFNGNLQKTDRQLGSDEHAGGEAEQVVSEYVEGAKEMAAVDIEKENERNGDQNSCLESEGKENDDGENPDNIEKDENKAMNEEKATATSNKDRKDLVSREDLKAIFQKYGIVKYIEFAIGEDSGYIRFEEPEAAQKARAAAALAEEGGLLIKNYIATLDPVTGEAERDYWSKLRGSQGKYREFKNNRGRGGRQNRGGKQFSGKHSRSRENNDSSNRPNKVQKVGVGVA